MRWLLVAVTFYGAVCAVLSETVTDGKPSIVVMARSSVYNVGERKAIYCKGLNLKHRLEWYSPSGELIEGRSNQRTRIYVEWPKNISLESSLLPLMMKSVKIDDSGNWTCKAGDELSETIEIFVGEKVQMDVKEVEYVGDQEKTARLICEAKGSPEPVVQWYKDNAIIKADQTKYSIKVKGYTHILDIKSLDHMDPGTYKCRATQEKLSFFSEKNFHLNVRHKPVITNHYTEREVYAIMNETKNITCNAIANPPPKFSWAKRTEDKFDQLITDENTVFIAEDGSYSVLMLKVYSEEALGQYKCSVQNDWGRQHIIFDVTLGNKPNPPTSVTVFQVQPYNITFNVTCLDCVFEVEEGVVPKPDNLNILGYNFQLVRCHEGFKVPYWENATEYPFDIENANETLFTVGPLINATEYHARVASRNAAGLSDWLPIHPNPKTADDAAALTVSITLLILAFITTCCY